MEEAFYKCYHATFKQLNHSFFSSSDEARSSSQASFAEVLRDAQNENNRNRQVCIALEWMNIDGTFNEKVPDKLRELLQVRVPYIS
ncbi:MAG: hypothetical protein M1486_05165 [Gammaproteobacteria bacterium]|nr:hypothetical protein [Gammaproteobacteria bacterium]